MEKRFSQACENNKSPILSELKKHFAGSKNILEIGSGTGQHAAHFAPRLTHLRWWTSDMPFNHDSIKAWLADCEAENVEGPIPFTVGQDDWPAEVDGVFSANTAHIMQVYESELMMRLVGKHLPTGGAFCQYGPFNVNGQYTSESNAAFDQHLAAEGCGGIRDINELQAWATDLTLVERVSMPANNFLLVWKRC